MIAASGFVKRLRRTPPWRWPWLVFDRVTRPLPFGLWLMNAFVQRILGVNGDQPWMVHFTSRVIGDVRIGRNVWKSFAVSGGCYIQGINGVHIGDDTIFAPGVKIISANHDAGNLQRLVPGPPVIIGRQCWIGANAVILPGVTLGDRVVVGAGAVVTRSFPDDCVIAGVPATLLRMNPPAAPHTEPQSAMVLTRENRAA